VGTCAHQLLRGGLRVPVRPARQAQPVAVALLRRAALRVVALLRGVAWRCMSLHGVAWVLRGVAWVLHGVAWRCMGVAWRCKALHGCCMGVAWQTVAVALLRRAALRVVALLRDRAAVVPLSQPAYTIRTAIRTAHNKEYNKEYNNGIQ
jgi:hypothetical protein